MRDARPSLVRDGYGLMSGTQPHQTVIVLPDFIEGHLLRPNGSWMNSPVCFGMCGAHRRRRSSFIMSAQNAAAKHSANESSSENLQSIIRARLPSGSLDASGLPMRRGAIAAIVGAPLAMVCLGGNEAAARSLSKLENKFAEAMSAGDDLEVHDAQPVRAPCFAFHIDDGHSGAPVLFRCTPRCCCSYNLMVKHHCGPVQKGIRLWGEAISLAPENSAAWSNRGTVFLQAGRYGTAGGTDGSSTFQPLTFIIWHVNPTMCNGNKGMTRVLQGQQCCEWCSNPAPYQLGCCCRWWR